MEVVLKYLLFLFSSWIFLSCATLENLPNQLGIQDFPLLDSDIVVPVRARSGAYGHYHKGEITFYESGGYLCDGITFDEDVYVVGVLNGKPALWVNGEERYLGDSGRAIAITTDGEQIFIGGTLDQKPCIWIGDQPNILTEQIGYIIDLEVELGEIYAVGNFVDSDLGDEEFRISGFTLQDQIITPLSEPAKLYSIGVSWNNVVIGGYWKGSTFDFSRALWINGEFTKTDYFRPYNIEAIGDSFYIAGQSGGNRTKPGLYLLDNETREITTHLGVLSVLNVNDEPVFVVNRSSDGIWTTPYSNGLYYRGNYYEIPEEVKPIHRAEFDPLQVYFKKSWF